MRTHLGAQLLHLFFLQKLLLFRVFARDAVVFARHSVKMPVKLANLIPARLIGVWRLRHGNAIGGESVEFVQQDLQVL